MVVSLLLVRAAISSFTGMTRATAPTTPTATTTDATTLACRRATPRSARKARPTPRLTNMPRLRVRKAGGRDSGTEASRTGRSRAPRVDSRYAITQGSSNAHVLPHVFVYANGAAGR